MQVTKECGFTLKYVREMIRTHSQTRVIRINRSQVLNFWENWQRKIYDAVVLNMLQLSENLVKRAPT